MTTMNYLKTQWGPMPDSDFIKTNKIIDNFNRLMTDDKKKKNITHKQCEKLWICDQIVEAFGNKIECMLGKLEAKVEQYHKLKNIKHKYNSMNTYPKYDDVDSNEMEDYDRYELMVDIILFLRRIPCRGDKLIDRLTTKQQKIRDEYDRVIREEKIRKKEEKARKLEEDTIEMVTNVVKFNFHGTEEDDNKMREQVMCID